MGIHKIRYQKQRPNVERVAACIRMHHPQYSNEAVEIHLEECVKNGSISKVVNKGLTSYRDPGSAPGRGQKTLHITGDMDLTKMFVKALREMANPNGSSIQSVERHIRKVYSVEVDTGYMLEDLLRSASRKAVSKNLASHDGSFTYFKSTSAFKKSANIKPKQTSSSSFSSKISSKHSSAPILEEKYEDTSRPAPLPICVECLGTDKCNPMSKEEALISCYGCGNSVTLRVEFTVLIWFSIFKKKVGLVMIAKHVLFAVKAKQMK